MMEKF
jgi:hypothetical protein